MHIYRSLGGERFQIKESGLNLWQQLSSVKIILSKELLGFLDNAMTDPRRDKTSKTNPSLFIFHMHYLGQLKPLALLPFIFPSML